jgi:hypothetical protein
LWYYFVYVARRIALCFAFFAVSDPGIQFGCVYMTNLLADIYIFCGAKKDFILQYLEYFNEILVHYCILLLATFTDFVPSLEV